MIATLQELLLGAEPIVGGQSGSEVYRVRRPGEPPRILKLLRPEQVAVHLREQYKSLESVEYRCYTELLVPLQVPAPAVYASGHLDGGGTYLLMEDLAITCRIPPEDHIWREDELRQILTTYARLHGRSLGRPLPDWLHADPRTQYSPDAVMACLRALADNEWTNEPVSQLLVHPGLPGLLDGVGRAMAGQPAAVLYNDFYPCNVALPRDSGPARLFDWQLVGSGPLHLDLSNIGLFRDIPSMANVDHLSVLEFYLDQLARETGHRLKTAAVLTDMEAATLMAWAVFLPTIVSTMQRCNERGRRFSDWMSNCYSECLSLFTKALA
jgi:hypothetical protein